MVIIDVIELVALDHIELYGNDKICWSHWKGQGIGLEELLEALSLGQSQMRSHDHSQLDIQNNGKDKSRRERESNVIQWVLEAYWSRVESMTVLLFGVTGELQKTIRSDSGYAV